MPIINLCHENLIDEVSKIVHLESTDIAYSSDNHYKDKRTAMITAEVRTEEDLDKLDEFFADASEKDDMIYIRGL